MEYAIVFLPLLAAIISGLGVRLIPAAVAQLITTGAVIASAVLSGILFNDVTSGNVRAITIIEWVHSGDFKANWSIYIDSLTAVMLIVVTWVSALVHVYSIGYMHNDPHNQRFFSYLSLFTFFMLMLVTSDNFLQLFLGWEGVGLCSYLLIGFWYKKPSANAAAIKAFIVNRVGDFGMALGIFAIFYLFGTIEYQAFFEKVPDATNRTINILGCNLNALNLIGILLFIGCMGKSAQLGLHTWLPDAMEGPTPVSALIHAATMVTAGVFLVARCSPLFEYAPIALNMVTIVGAATCLFAATIAITQNDIKRIIAYSTCSQLGYMFFACGVSAYSAGIFHLMTHAFFKALLFLGSGSVIHAMSDEQDIRRMGGIWKKIPITYAMFWVGSLALAGIPPFAGFYSKDIILESAYASTSDFGRIAFYIGLAAAFLTAFYSWRLILLTFHGEPRASKSIMEHVHESPIIMIIPLVLLATGAVLAGGYGVMALNIVGHEGEFWKSAIKVLDHNNPLEAAHHVPDWVKFSPVVVGVFGILVAYLFYMLEPGIPKALSRIPLLYNGSLNKWYVDEIYEALFVRPAKTIGSFLWKVGDIKIIDGFGPNGFAYYIECNAKKLSQVQTGYLYHYAFAMIVGLIVIMTYIIYKSVV